MTNAKGSRTSDYEFDLPPDLIARAKRVLGTRTETEAIVLSLEEATFQRAVERAVRKAGGKAPTFLRQK